MENLKKKLERIASLPEKKPHYSEGTPEASFDKNGVYFKVGQVVKNHSQELEWTNSEEDILNFNRKIKQYSNLEVV